MAQAAPPKISSEKRFIQIVLARIIVEYDINSVSTIFTSKDEDKMKAAAKAFIESCENDTVKSADDLLVRLNLSQLGPLYTNKKLQRIIEQERARLNYYICHTWYSSSPSQQKQRKAPIKAPVGLFGPQPRRAIATDPAIPLLERNHKAKQSCPGCSVM